MASNWPNQLSLQSSEGVYEGSRVQEFFYIPQSFFEQQALLRQKRGHNCPSPVFPNRKFHRGVLGKWLSRYTGIRTCVQIPRSHAKPWQGSVCL